MRGRAEYGRAGGGERYLSVPSQVNNPVDTSHISTTIDYMNIKNRKRPARPSSADKNGHQAHLYIDKETWARLEDLAEKEDRSVTAALRVLVKFALDMKDRGEGSTK